MRTSDHAGFGIPGFDSGEAIEQAQRYWQAWGEALRSVAGSGKPESQDLWRDALDRWTQLAGATLGAKTQQDPLDRFTQQARQWFGKMQDVAAQFTGRSASAADVVGAWRQAMGGQAENPFASMFSQMQGRGQSGFDQWYAQVAPILQQGVFGGAGADLTQFASRLFGGARDEVREGLHIPTFGLAREQQERWQVLAQAQLDLQEANEGYNALLAQAGRDAFERFEHKLAEHSEPGRQLQSARALFDLWIDAAEEAYAQIALSAEFRRRYAELVNAQMRVRAGVQREVETVSGLFGMPMRTEIDSAHRKIAELERELRRLRKSVQAGLATATAKTVKPVSSESAAPANSGSPSKLAPKKPAPKKHAPNKVATKSATSNRTVSRASPSKPAPSKGSASNSGVRPKATVELTASNNTAAKKATTKKATKRSLVSAPSAEPKTQKTKSSRAAVSSAAKRSTRPSIAISIPEAPQPMKADDAKTKNRKR
jgi:polyhydroxyalkanoate synthase subunit PhaE